MGDLERMAKKKRRRVAVEQALMGVLAATAILGLAATAPNAVQLLKYVDLGVITRRDPRRRLSESVSRLRRKGLVEWVGGDGAWHLRLTEKGRRHAARIRLQTIKIPRPRRWDRRWRFVMFDIPEKRRALRQQVRSIVTRLGFYRFQDSVWAYPYDCEEIVALFKLDLGAGNNLRYIVADAVEYDAPMRKHFGLPID